MSLKPSNNYSPEPYFTSSESETKLVEKILNSKICYINNSFSKYVNVGLSIIDFKPRILLGGQNGFHIIFTEENWKKFLGLQGVIANYFHSFLPNTSPIQFDGFTVYFENNNGYFLIKIQSSNGHYIRLAKETVDKLWNIEELINYRITILRKQDFEKYFNLFQIQLELLNPLSNIIETIYNVINPIQNTNSENVSTMLEMVCLYPKELEFKIKNYGSKKSFYNEISHL